MKRVFKSLACFGFLAVSLLSGCSDDLYVPAAGGDVIAFQTAPLTGLRAAAASEETLTSFTVSAWAHPAGGDYNGYIINSSSVTRNEGGSAAAWKYYPPAYFPLTGLVDFFAYAPASSVNITQGLEASNAAPSGTAGPSIVYKVPGYVGDPKTIDRQEDFLVSKRVNLATGPVTVDFKHALSRLVFKAKNIAQGKTFVIKKLSITNLKSTGTLAMNSLPDGTAGFSYPQDGTNYTTVWTNLSDPKREYAVDLGGTQQHVPFSATDSYTDITNKSNGLMVMPQATTLGEFVDPTEDSGVLNELVLAPDAATYLSVTVAEVDRVTQAVTGEQTLYFLVHDPYAAAKGIKKGIVFEAGRQYSFTLTLANGYVRFGAPTVSDFDAADYSVIYPFPCSTFTDARDGLVYKYCLFGNRYWMTENLAYDIKTWDATYGASVGYNKNNAYTPVYYVPGPNGNEITKSDAIGTTNASAYGNAKPGFIYNWAAAMKVTNGNSTALDTPNQGICPDGWHIPTDAEWTALEKVMVLDAYKEYSTFAGTSAWDDSWAGTNGVWRGSTQGQRMKSTTIVPGGSVTSGLSRPAGSGGFNGLLVGGAARGSTYNWDSFAQFWSSSSSSPTSAWYRYLGKHYDVVNRNADADCKYFILSVRCVQ